MKKELRIRLLALAILLAGLLSACDNGGTIRPDNGCVGQGANFNSCAAQVDNTLNSLGN